MIYLEFPKNFDPRFEVVGTFILCDGKFVLLHREDTKPQGNSWGIPSGKMDNDETKEVAAIRETQEETGIQISKDSLCFFKTVFVRYPEYDFIYHIFYFSLHSEPNIQIQSSEHKNFLWVHPTEALNMNLIGDLDECIRLFFI